MTNYRCKYGFCAKDSVPEMDTIFHINHFYDMDEKYISTDVCFGNFLEQRKPSKYDGPVYYSVQTIPDMLKLAVRWFSKYATGIKVTILDSNNEHGRLVNFVTKFVNFSPVLEYGNLDRQGCKYSDIILIGVKDYNKIKEIDEFTTIHTMNIRIDIDTDNNKVKPLLEYVTMCFFRLLDVNEDFLRRFLVLPKKGLIKNMLIASDLGFIGHTFYEIRRNPRRKLGYKELITIFNVDNAVNLVNPNKSYVCYRQTPIIDLLLERSR